MRPSARTRRLAAAAALAGAVAFALWRLWPRAPIAPLNTHYVGLGENLLHGMRETPSPWFRMPMGTALPTLAFSHLGLSPSWFMLPALGELVLLLALAALLGAPTPALAAGVAAYAALLRPDKVYALHPEAPFALHILLVCGLLILRAKRPTIRASLLVALALGSSLLHRSTLGLLPPLLAWLEWRRPSATRERWKHLLLLGAAPYLFLIPWIFMNARVQQKLVVFERGSSELNVATAALGVDDCMELLGFEKQELIDRPLERDESLAVWGAVEALAHPVRYGAGAARRIGRVFKWQPLLFLLAAFAAWRGGRERRLAALTVLYFVAVHCLVSVQERYFSPIWPLLGLLAVCAAGGAPPPDGRLRRAAAGVFAAALAVSLAAALAAQAVILRYERLASRRPPDSDMALQAALETSPDDSWLLMVRGRRLLAAGDAASAAAAFERAAPGEKAAGRDVEPLLSWARALAGAPAALLARAPSSAARDGFELPVYQAYALLRAGRAEAAREKLARALETHNRRLIIYGAPTPEKAALVARLRAHDNGFARDAAALVAYRPDAERAAFFAELTRLLPGSSRAWLLRAAIESDARRYQSALDFLEEAEAAVPGNEDRLLMNPLAYLRWMGLRPRPPSALKNDPAVLARALESAIPGLERVHPR